MKRAYKDKRPFSRRTFLGGVITAGGIVGGSAIVGAGLIRPASVRADDSVGDPGANPIPGGVAPFKPFGIFVHHNPLNPAVPLADISDPSQITDFHGFVGLTHFRGGGTGTNTITGDTMSLAYQADMGFSQGTFISADGRRHNRTIVFV